MIDRPSEKEQEYFVRLEAERIKRMRQDHQQKIAEQERKKLRDLHYMHCPKCGMAMATTSLAGVEIELCPDCGGLYLDAGELAKILEENRRGPALETMALARRIWKSIVG